MNNVKLKIDKPHILEDVFKWTEENIQPGNYRCDFSSKYPSYKYITFYFDNNEDAMAFKLKWC